MRGAGWSGSETGKAANKDGLSSQLSLWATRALSCCRALGGHVEHASNLAHWRGEGAQVCGH